MLTDFAEKMRNGADNITEVVKDTINFGISFEEALPATTYVEVEMNGKTYMVKIEATIIKTR